MQTSTENEARLILYTGKGGVGKSSISAATAVRCAELGHDTLLVSSDTAHNLGDILDTPVGPEPTSVAPHLWALEVDGLREIREHWGPMHAYLQRVLDTLGIENATAEEVALLPGMQEIFVLTRILHEAEAGSCSTVVVDCAPTGSTVRLLTFCDTAGERVGKIVELERRLLKLVRPFDRLLGEWGPLLPTDECYQTIGTVLREVGRLGRTLKAPGQASVRLVLNPNRIAVAETRRAFGYLGLFGFPVDAVVVNKVYPPQLSKGYLATWYRLQAEQLRVIDSSFADVARFRVPLLDHEPVGLPALAGMSTAVYGERDPRGRLCRGRTFELVRRGAERELRFPLPDLSAEDLDIHQRGGDLFVRAGAHNRVYALPDSLSGAEVVGAHFSDGVLAVRLRPAHSEPRTEGGKRCD